jgi:hypothetical protein
MLRYLCRKHKPSLLGRSAVELSLAEMMSIAIEAVGTDQETTEV